MSGNIRTPATSGGRSSGPSSGFAPPTGAAARRRRWVWTLITAVVLLAGATWAVISWRHRQARSAASAAPAGASMSGMPGMSAASGGQAAPGMEGMGGMSTAENGAVTLTAGQIHQFGITFGMAEVRSLTAETRATGAVTFDETKIAQVAPKFGGFVERLYVNSTGQPVRRGQPVLDIYSPDLLAAQQELLLAVQLQREIGTSSVPGVPAGSTNLVDAARRRLQLWDISEAQIDDILRTGTIRRTLTLYAPVSGVVVEKKVLQGQATMPGEALYTIADLSDVWIDVELREADAAAVRAGSGADIEFAGLPGHRFKGRVQYVYPMLQQEARSVRARVAVANHDGLLKPGMYATVRVSTPGQTALTVPSSALLRTGDRDVVFVAMEDGALMPHEVALGRVAGDYTEVLSGLEAGQRVVTSAQFLISSESNLGEVMKAMMGNMGAGDKPVPTPLPAPLPPRR